MKGEFQVQIPGRIIEGGIYVIPITYHGEGRLNGKEFTKKLNDKTRKMIDFYKEIDGYVNLANDGLQHLSPDAQYRDLEELFEKAFSEGARKTLELIGG